MSCHAMLFALPISAKPVSGLLTTRLESSGLQRARWAGHSRNLDSSDMAVNFTGDRHALGTAIQNKKGIVSYSAAFAVLRRKE
jgi:hypothetical protein